MFSNQSKKYHPLNTLFVIGMLCSIYLIFQLSYIPHAALSVDEFWFAYHINGYTHKLPYRDFLPYKTVLGYYILSVPMLIWHSVLQPLYFIKDEIAIINTILFAGISLWLTRFYSSKAVIYSVLFIWASHLFLIYSVDLRVDMLTSWLCLISFLLILSEQFALAGIVLSLSFMVSQKTSWFFVATNFALACHWLVISRNWRVIRQTIVFNLAVIIPFCFYIFFWAMQSSASIVFNSIFHEGYNLWKLTWYSQIYRTCWSVILSNGPLLMLLWPLTWISCFVRTENDSSEFARRFFIATYSMIIIFFIVSYQQAFPYGMVLTTPVYFLIYPDFFSWLSKIFQEKTILKPYNNRPLFWFISLYSISIVALVTYMQLSFAYYLITLIPICIGIYLVFPKLKNTFKDSFQAIILISLLCTGVLYPLIRFGFIATTLDNSYQKSMVTVSNELIKEGGGFFAGTPLLYDHDQAISGLNNLIGPAIEYLSNPSKKLLPILIPSLYLQPRTASEVLQDLKTAKIKFYVNNYRIYSLPAVIHRYLATEFVHYWGSIYIYAPQIMPKKQYFQIKFSGYYQIMTKHMGAILLDNKKIFSDNVIFLTEGLHSSEAKYSYRLKYMPANPIRLDKRYAIDHWNAMVKPIVI